MSSITYTPVNKQDEAGLTSGRERALILVKAVPRPSKTYQETVCCAGVTESGEWRRLFPVRFRQLAEGLQFRRWQWVDYRWHRPRDDRRRESRRVEEDSISPGVTVAAGQRLKLLTRILRTSTRQASAQAESLALIEPRDLKLRFRRKTPATMEAERRRYREAARQGLLLDEALGEIEPCPYAVQVPFLDHDGGEHAPLCEDWETTATFFHLRQTMADEAIKQHLEQAYTDRTGGKRVFLAMGTVKRRPAQWLLLGVLRVTTPGRGDQEGQGELAL